MIELLWHTVNSNAEKERRHFRGTLTIECGELNWIYLRKASLMRGTSMARRTGCLSISGLHYCSLHEDPEL